MLSRLTTYANLLPLAPERLVENCKFKNALMYNIKLKQYSVFDTLAYSPSKNQHIRTAKSRKSSISNAGPKTVPKPEVAQSEEAGVDFDFTQTSSSETKQENPIPSEEVSTQA